MTDNTASAVGIIGVGTASGDSVGYGLAKKLLQRQEPPEKIVLYNRTYCKSEAFLDDAFRELSHGHLKKRFSEPENDGVFQDDKTGDNSAKNLKYLHGSRKLVIRASPTLDDFLKHTDKNNSAVIVAYDAAKGWAEWLNSKDVPDGEKKQIRTLLYSHNLPGAIEIGEALEKFYVKQGAPHQAHRLIITNPPERINDTINMTAGRTYAEAAGDLTRTSTYSAIDADRVFSKAIKHIRKKLKDHLVHHSFKGFRENKLAGLRVGGGIHGNTTALFAEAFIGHTTFYEYIGLPSRRKKIEALYGTKEHFLELILTEAKREFLEEIRRTGGKTTTVILPSLAEIVDDLISDKSFDSKKEYSMGCVFKSPVTKMFFTSVWPVVYKDGRAWPLLRFGHPGQNQVSDSIEYDSGPAIHTYDFIANCLNSEEEIKYCFKAADSIEADLEYTEQLIEDPKERNRFIADRKNAFELPARVEVTSSKLDFSKLASAFFEQTPSTCGLSFRTAERLILNTYYSLNDVMQFINGLSSFEQQRNFRLSGCLVSALLKHAPDLEGQIEIDSAELSAVKPVSGFGMYNRGNLVLKGIFGDYTGAFNTGSITADEIKDFGGDSMENGTLVVERAHHSFFTNATGGRAVVQVTGKYAGSDISNTAKLTVMKEAYSHLGARQKDESEIQCFGTAGKCACQFKEGGTAEFFKKAGPGAGWGQKGGLTIFHKGAGPDLANRMVGGEIRYLCDEAPEISEHFVSGKIIHKGKDLAGKTQKVNKR